VKGESQVKNGDHEYPMNKGADEEEDEDEGNGMDKGHPAESKQTKFGGFQKSDDLTEEDLIKSMGHLVETAKQRPLSRKEELLHKSEAEGLTEPESVELVGILQGGSDLGGEIQKSMTPKSDKLKKAIEVSDFLREMHTGTTDGLTRIADRLEKSQVHQHEYNAALADGIVTLGRALQDTRSLVKSLTGQLEEMGAQPARAPRAKRGPNHAPEKQQPTQPLNKSMGGAPAGEGELSKSQVLDLMEEMMVKSDQNQYGMGGGLSKGGENIYEAIAAYEVEDKITRNLANEVLAFRQSRLN
jgi:hypothetical protein